MSNPILKPKRELTYVYGVGVIKKSEFTPDHLKKLIEHVKSCKIDVDEYIRTRFEVSGFADLPLFEESEAEKEKAAKKAEKERLKAEAKAAKEKEEADLLAQMEAEEAAKKSETASE
jgi:hypothetical protein